MKTLNWIRKGARRDRHFNPDGYLHYDGLEQARSAGAFDLASAVENSADQLAGRYEGLQNLNPQRLQLFVKMLEYCRIRNIRVKIFITPLHPQARAALASSSYEALLRLTAAFAAGSARAHHADFYDLSSLPSFQGRRDGFYDGEHMDESNADLITRKMLETNSAGQNQSVPIPQIQIQNIPAHAVQ